MTQASLTYPFTTCEHEKHRSKVDGVALRHDRHFLLHGAPTQDGLFEGLRTLFLVAVLA